MQEMLNKESEMIPRIASATTMKESSKTDMSVASSRTIHSGGQDHQWRHLGSRANSKQQPTTPQQPKFNSFVWYAQRTQNDTRNNLLFQQSDMLRLPHVPTGKLPGFNSQKSLHRTNIVGSEPQFRFRADSPSSSSSSESDTDSDFSSGSDDD